MDAILQAKKEDLVEIDGIGEVIADAFVAFMKKEGNKKMIEDLRKEMEFEQVEENKDAQNLENMNFVITGSLNHFTNRKEAQEFIEKKGGKVTGSVTSKTNYLINNDNTSNSSKNKKAKELQIPILTEDEFLEMFG